MKFAIDFDLITMFVVFNYNKREMIIVIIVVISIAIITVIIIVINITVIFSLLSIQQVNGYHRTVVVVVNLAWTSTMWS